jgi:hypothetical protein
LMSPAPIRANVRGSDRTGISTKLVAFRGPRPYYMRQRRQLIGPDCSPAPLGARDPARHRERRSPQPPHLVDSPSVLRLPGQNLVTTTSQLAALIGGIPHERGRLSRGLYVPLNATVPPQPGGRLESS